MEFWDIYDKNKQPTGRTMKRNDWTMADDEYHLTVLGIIETPDHRFLITQRVTTKSWAPGWWEVPGGGVRAGESSEDAVRREVLEETGIDLAARSADGGFVFTYMRENHEARDNYFMDVYRYIVDIKEEELKFQEAEVMGHKMATLDEIKMLAEMGIFLHYDSIRQVFES